MGSAGTCSPQAHRSSPGWSLSGGRPTSLGRCAARQPRRRRGGRRQHSTLTARNCPGSRCPRQS
eukprot:2189034-Pleurochrysis_carterae.AAC.1